MPHLIWNSIDWAAKYDLSLPHDLIRQFIAVVRLRREVTRQNRADLLDHANQRAGVVLFSKSTRKLIGQLVPKTLLAMPVQALISHNGKSPCVRSNENKSGIAPGGVVHLQFRKNSPSISRRVNNASVGDEHPYLTAGA